MKPYVYIMANRRNGAIYVGVTGNIAARMMQHRAHRGSQHCAGYEIDRLVYVEEAPTMHDAIAREKALKKWRREWKVRLIEAMNPTWDDLFHRINS